MYKQEIIWYIISSTKGHSEGDLRFRILSNMNKVLTFPPTRENIVGKMLNLLPYIRLDIKVLIILDLTLSQ
jgi:hypothetical protein